MMAKSGSGAPPALMRKVVHGPRPAPARRFFDTAAPRSYVAALTAAPTIQTKLKVGELNDRFEQEADRVAAQVMGMPDGALSHSDSYSGASASVQRLCAECAGEEEIRPPLSGPPAVQRLCATCEREDEKKLRRKPLSPEPHVGSANVGSCVQRQEIEGEEGGIQRRAVAEAAPERVQTEAIGSGAELTTGGSALSHSVRTFYESRLGYD